VYNLEHELAGPTGAFLVLAENVLMQKYARIYRDLIAQIEDGALKEGNRLPTEVQLSRMYSVSRPTVARALRELTQAGYVERKSGLGTYVRDRADESDTTLAGRTFGLLVPGLGRGEIFEPIFAHVAKQSHRNSFNLLWSGAFSDSSSVHRRETLEICDWYIQQHVDGIFFVPLELDPESKETNSAIAQRFHAAQIPLVLVDSDFEGFPERSSFDLVGIDNLRWGYRACQHLTEQGASRVAFISQPYAAYTVELRARGHMSCLIDSGADCNSQVVHIGDPQDRSFVKSLLDSGARDFVCGNDETALLLMHTLGTLGLEAPSDVRIVGFDDIKYARIARPPLTTVHQRCSQIAELAVETLRSRIADPQSSARTVFAEASLQIRSSSAFPQGGGAAHAR
jgi:DNA-binding LacI/PurR family transcriptional regulator